MSTLTRRSIAHRYATRASLNLMAEASAANTTITSTKSIAPGITSTSNTANEQIATATNQVAPPNDGPKPVDNDLYKQLQDLEEQDGVIRNIELIFCLVCDTFVDVYDGILVRECLHHVCIDCIRKTIIECTNVAVKCPANDCEYSLQDREIRSLLTQTEYERHTNKYNNQQHSNNEALYKELLDFEEQNLIHNIDPFECEICFSDVAQMDGILIRECLHQFCIDCVRNTINLSEEAEILCPANDCQCYIQDREIRSLLTQAEFDKYTAKTLRIAESKATNSYHCKKANCEGWCFVEDAVNTFVCPRCKSQNCLSCQAIHPRLNCQQYQDELRFVGMNDDQRSQMCLDEIVQQNLGMRCTNCKIVIMKRDGCDALTCSMCKTELCWATKMSRWGPKGRGDTSGGCRCLVAKKCHPNCRNCH